uniref:CSON004085 protein n=1 Tax=Culicoides sonorensis TaxID=179676 RepID=A0A336MQJ6_CULSO
MVSNDNTSNYGTVNIKTNNNSIEMTSNDYNEIPDDDDYRESLPSMQKMLKGGAKTCCSTKMLKRRVPIVEWAPKYKPKYLFEDFVAGLTVGLTAIPQGIAYAVVAGLPPQYGLYSGFMGCFVYIFFGSCKAATIGPTAIMAIMTQPYVDGRSPDFAILLSFMSGLITLGLGLLNLGFLVQFISTCVISGFTTAAAITIASGQIKALLALPNTGPEFLDAWENFFKNVKYTKWQDATLGITSIIILLLLKKVGEHKGRFKYFTKYLSLSRNALIVFAGTLIAYIFDMNDSVPFVLTGEIEKGFPPIGLPPFSTEYNNETIGFSEMINVLGSATVAIPLISILESVTIATIFCEKGAAVDATQEMIAVGLCNIVGSFVASMPTTGSFTRSAVNHHSGVRSPLGGLFTGALVLLALGLLTSTFYYIPKATLAAVIIAAMFPMMEFHEIYETFKTKKIDIIPLLVTLFSCLFVGLEYGILIGVGVNLVIVLLASSRPNIDLDRTVLGEHELLIVTPKQDLIFTCADFFRYKTIKYVVTHDHVDLIAINGQYIQNIDMTAMKKLANMIDSLKDQDKQVYLWNWHHKTAYNLVMRYNKNYKNLFKFTINSDDLIFQLKQDVVAENNNHVSEILTR